MNKKTIATFGKHMVCPNIINDDLKKQGIEDYKNYKYKHLSTSFKGDSNYSNQNLLKHLKNAILNIMPKDKKPILFLSDGKDSLTLALAMNELGIEFDTLTLLRDEDIEVKNYILSVAKFLNFHPQFISTKEIIDSIDIESYKESFNYMEFPILDQSYLFFFMAVKIFFEKNNFNSGEYFFIDGMGNDEYFGHMPSKQQLNSFKVSRLKLWKLLPKCLKSFKWYIRSRIESHGLLSTLACFFEFNKSHNLNKYVEGIEKSMDKKQFLDFRAFTRGQYLDTQCMIGKNTTVAKAFDTICIYPWLDEKLANYCFNIPIDEKLDFENIVNKIPLRKILEEKIDWHQTKRGVDLFFDLNMNKFYDDVISKIVPKDLINVIKNNKILNDSIKKRAYLELLNFYTYCSVKEKMSDDEIRELLN